MALLGVHAAHAKWLFGLVSMAACATAVAVACLPDLESTVIRTGPMDSGANCGNGYIEPPEQCDPGKPDTSVPGCTRDCKIECEAGVSSFVDDKTSPSNHCYFLLSADAGTLAAATAACMAESAHVMTAGSTDEQTAVSVGLTPVPSAQRFWLGLDPVPPKDGGGFTYSSVIDEPGLANLGTCPGCYAPSGGDNHELFLHLDDADASADCITWRLGNQPLWSRANCDSHFPTICEREPVGSRSYMCSPPIFCFTVPLTFAEGKVYKWSATPMTASKAAGLCSELSNPPNGAASLVVFGQDDPSHAEEEREQVFYELLHLPSVVAGTTPEPTDFWIGLSSSSTDAGITWTWDDGHLEDYFPLPWGNHEPKAKEPGVRAFSLQTGTTAGYEAPATTYDTQLAHARDPADAGADGGDGGDGGGAVDAGVELHAVLCQQYSMTH
jgi:hypothetical protein